MTDRQPAETEAAPAGEHIHMPAPSLLPLVNAASLALVIIFITMSLYVAIFGAIVFVITTVIWIRSTARDVNELPLEH